MEHPDLGAGPHTGHIVTQLTIGKSEKSPSTGGSNWTALQEMGSSSWEPPNTCKYRTRPASPQLQATAAICPLQQCLICPLLASFFSIINSHIFHSCSSAPSCTLLLQVCFIESLLKECPRVTSMTGCTHVYMCTYIPVLGITEGPSLA